MNYNDPGFYGKPNFYRFCSLLKYIFQDGGIPQFQDACPSIYTSLCLIPRMVVCLFFETGYLCVVLTILELAL